MSVTPAVIPVTHQHAVGFHRSMSFRVLFTQTQGCYDLAKLGRWYPTKKIKEVFVEGTSVKPQAVYFYVHLLRCTKVGNPIY